MQQKVVFAQMLWLVPSAIQHLLLKNHNITQNLWKSIDRPGDRPPLAEESTKIRDLDEKKYCRGKKKRNVLRLALAKKK